MLSQGRVKVEAHKCSFLLHAVKYLGYKITKEGLQSTSEKVKSVQKFSAPKDVSQLKSFLGLVNCYSKFLPDLLTILAPLYKLMQETEWK